MGAKFPRNESSRERKLARIFVPGSERAGPFRSRERNFQGAKWTGSEWARERKGQAAKGPGSELARVLLVDSLLGAKRLSTRPHCWMNSNVAASTAPRLCALVKANTVDGASRSATLKTYLWS